MSTTWSGTLQIKEQIQALLNDAAFETGGSKVDLLLPWANAIVNEIASEIDIRYLLSSDTTSMVFTTSDVSIALPSNFMKKSNRFTTVRYTDKVIPIIGLDELRTMDTAQTLTTANAYPDNVAIEGGYMYAYPLFNGTLTMENYYRFPTAMTVDGSIPNLPNDNARTDLIITGVIGKYGYPLLGEFDLAKFYYNRDVVPPMGQFFTLLEVYRANLQKSDSTLTNQAKDY